MSTGRRNTPDPITGMAGVLGAGAGPYTGPHPAKRAVNKTVNVYLVLGVATPVPSIKVGPGESVFLRAASTNTGNTLVATSPEILTAYFGGGAYILSADTEISFPVDDTGQRWLRCPAANGNVMVSVRMNSVG